MMTTTKSERTTRVIDFDQEASMEQKKREGYFYSGGYYMATLNIKEFLDQDEKKRFVAPVDGRFGG